MTALHVGIFFLIIGVALFFVTQNVVKKYVKDVKDEGIYFHIIMANFLCIIFFSVATFAFTVNFMKKEETPKPIEKFKMEIITNENFEPIDTLYIKLKP